MAIRFDQIELSASNHQDYPVLSHGGNGLQITTSTGSGNLGSGNSSYFHISTDRGTFYFSKPLSISGNIASYGGTHTASFATYYDSNNTAYYVNPAGTSVMNDIELDDYIVHGGDTNTYFGFNGADSWKLHVGGGDRLIAGTSTLTSNLKVRIPVAWDSGTLENNAIYAKDSTDGFGFGNGTGISTWWAWSTENGLKRMIDCANSGDYITLRTANTDRVSITSSGLEVKNNGDIDVGNLRIVGDNSSGDEGKAYIRSNGDYLVLNAADGEHVYLNWDTANGMSGHVYVNDRVYAKSLYDRNNTNYFMDPSGNSTVYQLYAGSTGGDQTYNIRLEAADKSSIGFHDSGSTIGAITFSGSEGFRLGANQGSYGPHSVSAMDRFYVSKEVTDAAGQSIKGYRLNKATSSSWAEGGTGAQTGWYGGNFGGSEITTKWVDGPHGERTLAAETTGDTNNDYDGGFVKAIDNLDINKSHLSIVYIKRISSETTGSVYHGTGASTNQITNLAGTSNTNPYFHSHNIGSYPQDVWCVSIGVIQANNDSNTTNKVGSDDLQGVYRCDTGQKILNSNTTWKMGSAGSTLSNGIRFFHYYSTNANAKLQFAKPGFYEINGDEPSLAEILTGGNRGLHTNGGDVTANKFYDWANTAYYIDPASDSEMNQIRIDDYIRHRGDLDTFIGFPGNNVFRVETNGSTRLNIDSGGKVGINTTDADGQGYPFAEDLVILGGASANDGVGLTLRGNGKTYGVIAFGDNADDNAGEIYYNHNNDTMSFRAATAVQLVLTNTLVDGQNNQFKTTNAEGLRIDSASYARMELDANNNWSYVRFMDNGNVSWDLATYDSGVLEIRPGGGGSNRTYFNSSGVSLSEGSKRAPVFYDSNNTSYFFDGTNTDRSMVTSGSISIGTQGQLGLGDITHPKIVYPGKEASWDGSGSTTGQVVIDLPGDLSDYDMMYMEIHVYEYSSDAASKIIIGGHNWNSGGNSGTSNTQWHNNGVQVIGSFSKPIYLGRRNDGTSERRCIALGDTTSTWSYGTVHVAKVHGACYYSDSIDWMGDWNVAQTTSSSYFTKNPTTNWNANTTITLRTNGRFNANFVTAASDMKAPLYYDSNNTSAYVNPAGDSAMHAIGLDDLLFHNGDGDTHLSFGTNQIKLTAGGTERFRVEADVKVLGSTDLNIQGTSRRLQFTSGTGTVRTTTANDLILQTNSTTAITIDSNQNTIFSQPVWIQDYIYHHGDSNTYFGFNGADQFALVIGGTTRFSSVNSGASFNFASHISMNNKDIDYVNQLHFNSNTRFVDMGNNQYLKFKYGGSGGGGIRFYDGGDQHHGYIYCNGSGEFGLLDSDGHWSVRIPNGGTGLELRSNNNAEFTVNNDHTLSHGSSRAPIFYDSGNTTYFVDPASTGTSGKFRQYVNIGDSSSYSSNSGSWGARLNVVDGVHARIDVAQDADSMQASWYAHTGHAGSYIGTTTDHHFYMMANNSVGMTLNSTGFAQAAGSMRAPIFYDSNDTGYYVDPATSSSIKNLTVGPRLSSGTEQVVSITHGSGSHTGVGLGISSANSGHALNITGTVGSGYARITTAYNASPTFSISGDVIAYAASDKNFKDDLTVIPNALDKINTISGYTFTWNDKQTTYDTGKKDVGVVAQEIETVLPEIVDTRFDGSKAVKYDRIVALLIEGIKELQEEVKELKDKCNGCTC